MKATLYGVASLARHAVPALRLEGGRHLRSLRLSGCTLQRALGYKRGALI